MIMAVYNGITWHNADEKFGSVSVPFKAACQLPASGVPGVAASGTGPWPGGGVSCE